MTVYSKNWKNYEIFKPTITSDKFRYITVMTFNLPGTGDTMIKRVVPSGGGQCIAPSLVEACYLPKRGRLGCTIFDSRGLHSCNPHLQAQMVEHYMVAHKVVSIF